MGSSSDLCFVFYRTGNKDTNSFQGYGNRIAESLKAPKMPYEGGQPTTKDGAPVYAANGVDIYGNAIARAALYASNLGGKVAQLHVIGHIPSEGANGLRQSMTAEDAKMYAADAKIVLHGCDGATVYLGKAKEILALLPGGSCYAHGGGAEAGGPLDFRKLTGATGGEFVFVQRVIKENIGFTQDLIDDWATRHIKDVKAGRKDRDALDAIHDWLDFPVFNSWESFRLAQLIMADTANIPDNIVTPAQRRIGQWGITGAVTPAPPTHAELQAKGMAGRRRAL